MTCPNIHRQNFLLDAGITREIEVRIMLNGRQRVILRHGYIIKDVTNIIMNIGSIIV